MDTGGWTLAVRVAATGAMSAGRIQAQVVQAQVASGAAIIAASAAQARTYLVFGLASRAIRRMAPYNAATNAPCQRKWSKVHPRRSTQGCDASSCTLFI
jgi:hypothetical protein